MLPHLCSLDLHVLENGRHFAKLVSEVGRGVDVHFQGPEEGALLHASQELGLRLLLLAAAGKGLEVSLLVGPLTFSDRHHRQLRHTLQVLALLLRSLRPFPHELQELDGLGRDWIPLHRWISSLFTQIINIICW